ncbi:MAG TPA: VWA domain-containing protein [Bacteroidota bacterium]|nr:VWA domain-containing protein [Bacteroidota bacterium]
MVHILCRRNLATLLFAVMLVASAVAQPTLDFRRVTLHHPTIELYFTVTCGGVAQHDESVDHFRVLENGTALDHFNLMCSDSTQPENVSMVMLMDCSNGMAGEPLRRARDLGHALIDRFDGVVDEGTVMHFNNNYVVYQQVTSIKPMLYSAIDAIGTAGSPMVMDALYAGISELLNTGTQRGRAVVLVTQGQISQSIKTIQDVLTLAERYHIALFVVAVDASQAAEYAVLCGQTGGKFYPLTDLVDIESVADDIHRRIRILPTECMIRYRRDCADSTMREVTLEVLDVCGGNASDSKSYRAPLDSTTFHFLQLGLGDAETVGGQEVIVPLNLSLPTVGDDFPQSEFTLQFDQQCLQFKSISVPTTSPLHGVSISYNLVPGGIRVVIPEGRAAPAAGVLMYATFQSVDATDTLLCDVTMTDLNFNRGCKLPVVEPGRVTVLPRVTSIDGARPDGIALQVFPEPATDWLTVQLANAQGQGVLVQLVDALGRSEILFDGVASSSQLSWTVDLTGRGRGVYFILLHSGRGSQLRKIVTM